MAAATPSQTIVSHHHGEEVGDEFGYAVAGGSDIDGDGVPDMIVGARFHDLRFPHVGKVYAYSGATGNEIGSATGFFSLTVGWSVSPTGDVNADGFGDIAVGVPGDIQNGVNSGTVWVLSGADFSSLYSISNSSAGDRLGFSIDRAGDVDADGFDDFIAGAPYANGPGIGNGAVHVYSGFDGSVLYTKFGDGFHDRFGVAVSGVGDVDGDGYDDFAVGAPQDDNTGSNAGSVRVFSGFDGSTLYTVYGDAIGDTFGSAIDGGRDIDGDGTPDLIVGMPYANVAATDTGAARILSGVDGSTIDTLSFDGNPTRFGHAVALTQDLDGDCRPDIVVGAHLAEPDGTASGIAVVYSGQTRSLLHTFLGSNRSNFGWSVADVGDLDQDGLGEIAVGAPTHSDSTGRVSVYEFGGIPDMPRHKVHEYGCVGGANRLPRIGFEGHARIGSTITPTLRAAAPTTTAALMLGDPAAIPLDVLGMAGCNLWVSPFATFNRSTDALGRADFDIDLIPISFSVGQSMTCQWIVLDPAAPYALTVSVSDAFEFEIGN